MVPPCAPSFTTSDRRSERGRNESGRAAYNTARYRSSSHSVSCTRYSSHSFRFSST
jgi:hypothetical protein